MLTQILVLILHLEAGWQPLDTWRGYNPGAFVDKGLDIPLYGTLGVELEIAGVVFFGFDVKTEMTVKEIKAGSFSPHLMNYGFTAGIRLANGVEIGFRHHCLHPIVPYMMGGGWSLNFEGGYEEVYLKIDKRITLF